MPGWTPRRPCRTPDAPSRHPTRPRPARTAADAPHPRPVPGSLAMTASTLPVAIIGAGPVGLAAAAHLLARGLEPLVLEAGPGIGAAVHAWGHVRMFSPWRYNTD